MTKELTIQLDAKTDKMTVNSLVVALEKALALLRTLDPNDEWEVVRITKRSPFKLVVRNPSAANVAPPYMDCLRKMNRKMKPSRLPDFTEKTLMATYELAGVLNDGFKGIKLLFPGQRPVTFTPQVVQNVNEVAKVATEYYYEWTSIRGLLYQITWSESATRCRIRDVLSGAEIPCVVSQDLLDTVKDALPHRVDVYGRTKCNRLGSIASIEVETIRVLPNDKRTMELTPPTNITGGMESREYVERVRRGD